MAITINYYVRRSFEKKEYQKGAFESLELAKKCCDKYPGYNVYLINGELVYSGAKATTSQIIKNAIFWAKATANDNRHGYNNTKTGRGGNPDYACSSFVNEAYRQAGVDLPVSKDVYTAKMKSIYLKAGFIDITKNVNFKTKKGLAAGDVLLSPGKHTELYVGSGKVAGARGNANSGHAENGKAGDQTGGEIYVSAYWNYPWKIALRYVGGEKVTEDISKTGKTYSVQAGYFKDKKNAENLVSALKEKQIHSILKKTANGYYVRIGLYKEKKNAETIAAVAKKNGFSTIIKEVS